MSIEFTKTGGFSVKDMIQYKGYYGSVHYSDIDHVLFGKVEYNRKRFASKSGFLC